jgi:hypothetical protein
MNTYRVKIQQYVLFYDEQEVLAASEDEAIEQAKAQARCDWSCSDVFDVWIESVDLICDDDEKL